MKVKLLAAVISQIVWKFLTIWLVRADAKKDAAAAQYIDTRKRMDEADIVGDDPDLARRWLSERGDTKRDL